jgi:hypothetical protein
MEPYPSGQFGFIDDPDRQFVNGSVRTRTRTRSDGPELLLTLAASMLVNNLWMTGCSIVGSMLSHL